MKKLITFYLFRAIRKIIYHFKERITKNQIYNMLLMI